MNKSCLHFGLWLVISALVACASALESKTWFPDNPSLQFVAGELINSVIAIRNTGSSAVNLTHAYGSLSLVSNPTGSIYNFTATSYMLPEVDAEEEAMVDYKTYMPPNMPPRDFILRLNLYLNSEGEYQAITVFNETISILEQSKLIDTELLGLYAIMLGVLAAAGYGLFSMAQKQGWIKKPRKTKAGGIAATADKSEWLKGTVADKNTRKAAAGLKQS